MKVFDELIYNEDPGDMATHTPVLYALARGTNPRTIVELGVRTGESTKALILGLRDSIGRGPWEPRNLFSVDINEAPEELLNFMKEHDPEGFWSFYQTNSIEFAKNWFIEGMSRAASTSIDLLMIDADHSYGASRADLLNFSQYVTPGGFVVMHDALAFPTGVGRTVDEVKWPKMTLPWSNGLTLIRRPVDNYEEIV